MTDDEIAHAHAELLRQYPGANIVVVEDRAAMIAEVTPGRAVAVIERIVPHFHRKMTEVFRGLRGTLYVACGGRAHVLGPGDSLTIQPGTIHYARGATGPAWIEVSSDPPWTPDDHLLL